MQMLYEFSPIISAMVDTVKPWQEIVMPSKDMMCAPIWHRSSLPN